MSSRAVAWMLVAVIALTLVLLFNYWAAYQPLSTLVYTGMVLALCGLANVVVPFRFLGVRKRAVGALVLGAGVALSFVALYWPAATIRVAERKTRLDEIMPEYQFFERHSVRVHARPEQAMEAVREATFGDMKSLGVLLRIRAAALRAPFHASDDFQSKRILDAFSESGFLSEDNEHEVVRCGAGRAGPSRPEVRTLQEFVDFREQGGFKLAYDFTVEDAGGGWSRVSTETRMVGLGADTRRGMGRYWRLIVPGSGLLRREWLEGIKKRAETMANERS
jgi:hypothetical protein